MYIYHVENVRAGQGGRLYLEIPQNGLFRPAPTQPTGYNFFLV